MLPLSSFTLVAQYAWASTFEIKIENTGTVSTFACSSRNQRQNHESGYFKILFGTVWQRNALKSVPHDSFYSFNQSHYSFMALAASMQFRNDRAFSQWLRRQKRWNDKSAYLMSKTKISARPHVAFSFWNLKYVCTWCPIMFSLYTSNASTHVSILHS